MTSISVTIPQIGANPGLELKRPCSSQQHSAFMTIARETVVLKPRSNVSKHGQICMDGYDRSLR